MYVINSSVNNVKNSVNSVYNENDSVSNVNSVKNSINNVNNSVSNVSKVRKKLKSSDLGPRAEKKNTFSLTHVAELLELAAWLYAGRATIVKDLA